MSALLYPATRKGGRWIAVIPIEVAPVGCGPSVVAFLLDSGASRSSLPSAVVERLTGQPWAALAPAGRSYGLGGPIEMRELPGELRHDGIAFASPIRVFESTGSVPAHAGLDFFEAFAVGLRLHEPEPVFLVETAGASSVGLSDGLRVVVPGDQLARLVPPRRNRAERRRLARSA